MSDAFFGYGELNEFSPQYGGVNWRESYERPRTNLPKPAWFEAEDNDGTIQMQLNQENFIIYTNATNPNLDTITVIDPRDGGAIWWTRETMGHEQFEAVVKAHRSEALTVRSKYPLEMIVNLVLKQSEVDIQLIEEEGLPEDIS